jgi:multidrug resistance efflux pump
MTDAAPLPEPPPPPPIPPGRRAARLAARAWPFVVWCAALGAAVWLYFGETGHGHALAFEEVHELRVSQASAGRIIAIPVEVGQKVREGEVLAVLEAAAADPRLPPSKVQVLAPAAGAVSKIDAHVGQSVLAGADIVRMVVPRPNRLIGYVTDRQIRAVEVGTLATLRPRELGGPPLQGKVIGLGPQIEELPLRLRAVPNVAQWGRRVVFQVENPREALPGQIYEVRFH